MGNPKPGPVRAVSGFMSASVDGLVHGYKSMWNNRKLYEEDINMAPVTWNNSFFTAKKKLRIGYCSEAFVGPFAIHPSYNRAILEAKDLLEKAGHEMIEFPLPDVNAIADHYSGYIYSDNFEQLTRIIENDVLVDSAVSGIMLYSAVLRYTPKWFQKYVINGLLSLKTIMRISR